MKALILAGGENSRLVPYTESTSKILIKVKGKTLLERLVDPLLANKVDSFVFLTGRLSNQVEDFFRKKYPQIEPVFSVDSPERPAGSGYIYSMWQARRLLGDTDILYIHGDVFCDPVLIERIANFKSSGALVNPSHIPEKDFKAKVTGGLIKKIGVDVFGEGAAFCLPFYKLRKEDFNIWIQQIDKYVKDGRVNCYAENALNDVLSGIQMRPVYFNEAGMEIDNPEDLKEAESF